MPLCPPPPPPSHLRLKSVPKSLGKKSFTAILTTLVLENCQKALSHAITHRKLINFCLGQFWLLWIFFQAPLPHPASEHFSPLPYPKFRERKPVKGGKILEIEQVAWLLLGTFKIPNGLHIWTEQELSKKSLCIMTSLDSSLSRRYTL